jgi:acetate---CoA ligase (ADP-forming)
VAERVTVRTQDAELAIPDSAVPDGAVPDGAVPDGAVPDGAVPDGAVPDSAVPDSAVPDSAVRAMVEARSVALVGASPRPGTFGNRMLEEAGKSRSRPRIFPVNPRYSEIEGQRCYPSLAELPEAPELTLLAVPDGALESQLTLAVDVGSRAAVIFGNAAEAGQSEPGGRARLRDRLAAIARAAGMAVCGAGCMGFANVSHGLRALGYTEPDPLPAGPVALVTHSGSVFSAMLRARRGFGFTLAVSSGQELVTAAPAYLEYALDLPDTQVLALVLETIRDGGALRRVLARAAERDMPVVLLTAGSSAAGRGLVAAHSGALAGSDGGWEALARAYGVHRVSDLTEFADTIELFAIGGRVRKVATSGAGRRQSGIATVHDSGLERAHVADVASSLGVPFAEIGPVTMARLASVLDPGLTPANPLDVWGTGAGTRELFGGCLSALADDGAVDVVALAVDLVHELDGDDAYLRALQDVARRTSKPLVVLSNLPSVIDQDWAGQLRRGGVPVLEGTKSGLLALRHLRDHACERPFAAVGADLVSPGQHQIGTHDRTRRDRAVDLLSTGAPSGGPLLELLAEYGISVARTLAAEDRAGALAAAAEIGYPVVVKTGQPEIAHKSDVGGVVLGIADRGQLTAVYDDLAARLGPLVLVSEAIPAGVELSLGVVCDPELGPLVVVGAGGVLVELLADRAVALPPLTAAQAADLLGGLRVARLLAGVRGAQPADLAAVRRAICGVSHLAIDLGNQLEALDINPLICGPAGAVAVDALAVPRRAAE